VIQDTEQQARARLAERYQTTPAVFARLEVHLQTLATWNDQINLVGPNELQHYWSRHALDCAQLIGMAQPGSTRWIDLGSGAGFPGLVIAAYLKDIPGASVDLVEKSPKKGQFLTAAGIAMDVPIRVLPVRAEVLPDTPYDVVTARAFAPLPRLIEHAKRYLTRGATGLFPKGSNYQSELAAAGFSPRGGAYIQGSMRAEVLESISNPDARVLRIQSIASEA
jgi:16S rRNA (guanine527-N7)-methyltransferase